MPASWKRSERSVERVTRMVGASGAGASGEPDPVVPPRFARHLRGAANRRRGDETPWVAVVRVDGVDAIRAEWGDPAAEEFLRSTASALRASLRESDKLSPVGRAEYGIILDAPSADAVVAGLERLVGTVAELAGRDRRWSGGSLCVGVTPLDTAEAKAVLNRARDALDRGEELGGRRGTMAASAR
jgi:GGDEF domain-containing protein